MNKKKAITISLILLGCGILFMFISYFMFHYLTDDGFIWVKQEESGKPFVTQMVGIFSTLCYFGALVFLLVGVVNPKEK